MLHVKHVYSVFRLVSRSAKNQDCATRAQRRFYAQYAPLRALREAAQYRQREGARRAARARN